MAALPVAKADASALEEEALGTGSSVEADWVALIAMALVGLIPIGLAVLAFVLWRGRSRRLKAETFASSSVAAAAYEMPTEEAIEEERVPAEPAIDSTAPIGASRFLDTEPMVPVDTPMAPVAPATMAPTNGKVVLPRDVPATVEERAALIRELANSEPDRANPFVSRKARLKRARLIVQSLGRSFRNATPRIDLSQYSYRWPHLARPATA
ncbi:hypothetical protein P7228_00330 [Altererythrobacter arenosus]|uniref:Uncharacterized protein n=1 Tax=Altererythrobacter arenosus TaxID=3032592 RepID=A0ABY8FR98_9SPHN|nr:hypothetical protein [Altererythrobacter sp. CAU 1644]WFL77544.1 hypothetical protein P7228_00330 [Altererythrobacter sp. CAU 1644]